jgi:exodeoxyribonuclease VII small subunit
MDKKEIPLSELSYEQAFTELEGIVEALEGGQKPLEESLKLFERGQVLVKYCGGLLEQADLRIRKLDPGMISGKGE